MKLELVRDRNDDPEITPDDFFQAYGLKAAEWIAKATPFPEADPNKRASGLARRCDAYLSAYKTYLDAAQMVYPKRGDPLRQEPWVIQEYDSHNSCAAYLFIFKADNNGNTYRVRVSELD